MTKKKTTEMVPITDAADNGLLITGGSFEAFDLLVVPVLGIDAGGKIVYANPSALRFFDHPGKRLLGAPLAEVGSPIIAGGWAKFWTELKNRGFSDGKAVLWPDSHRTTPIHWRALCFRNKRQAQACIFLRSQEQPAPLEFDLDRDQRQLIRLVENLVQPLLILDEHHKVVHANPKACEFLGMTTHQAAGKTALDLLPEPLAGRIREKQQQALDTRQPVRVFFDVEFAEAAGISATIIPFFDQTSSRWYLVVVVNGPRRREADGTNPAGQADSPALPIPISQLRTSFHAAPFLAVIKDCRKRFMWVNPAFALEFGIDPGKPLEEEMHARFGTVGAWAEEDEQVMVTKRPIFNIVEHIGGRGFYRKDKIPLLGENGEVVGLLGVIVPLKGVMTDQTTGENRYRRVFRKLDRLNADIQAWKTSPPRDTPQPPGDRDLMKQLVLPYVNHLRRGRLNKEQRRLLGLIEKSIESHTPELPARDYRLSPNEVRVAHWVREGKTNEEIAALMGLSKSTILTHRHHVRVKLGLKNKKVNLRTFLSELIVA